MQQLEIIDGKLGGALKTVLYGPEGIGKSTLAAHFPRPLFIDTEGSTRHMAVSRTKKPSSWSMLLETAQYIRSDPGVCSTLVIDTADWAEQLCIAHICAQKKLTGIEDMGYGKGYVYLAEEFGRLLNTLEEIVDLGIHVVLTAHAKMRKFEQPDEMGAYDRWELKLQPKTAALVKEWSDLLLFANYKTLSVAVDDKGKKFKAQGGRRIMYTTHHPCWDAKNRLGLPDEMPLDYTALAHYIETNAAAAQVTASVPASVLERSDHLSAQQRETAEIARTCATQTQKPDLALNRTQEDRTEPDKPAPSGALAELRDLMRSDGILDYAVQAAVEARGYYPPQTPLENMDEDFIRGVLVGAWPIVRDWIQQNKPLPF